MTMNETARVEAPIGRGPGAVTVRPRLASWLGWVSAVVTIVVFVVIAVILRNTATGVFFRLADQVAMVLFGLFVAAGCLLFARPRVRADERGIEVRNVGLAKTLPWSVVERVGFPDGASWARLDLPDYEYLPVLAIQAVDRQHAVDAIRKVRALHAAAHR
ncbi:PH domain-containing protein [Pseudonocardia oroxyli]|uniref:PH domain-containing protein n=2 Tax=Pseudonocardia oroxyli TaxID=366584 RepID=A0A1G7I0E5_PSEOR|nr:PH domain-containing protein [Pseudonocardia oroxyli]